MSSFEIQIENEESNNLDIEIKKTEFRLYLTNEITPENATALVQEMYDLNDVNKALEEYIPIVLIINSPGGCLHASQMVCDVMDEIETPVHTKCMGQACSGGIMIFMNGERGHRIASENSQFMSHRFSTAVEGSHSDLKYHNIEMERMFERLVKHYCKKTGLSRKKIESELLAEHDVWLDAHECKKLNIVDKIIEGKKGYVRRKSPNTNRK